MSVSPCNVQIADAGYARFLTFLNHAMILPLIKIRVGGFLWPLNPPPITVLSGDGMDRISTSVGACPLDSKETLRVSSQQMLVGQYFRAAHP